MSVKPIKPSEVAKRKVATMPDEVVQVFNDLIVEKWDGGEASVFQDEVIKRIAAALKIERHEVFKKGYLDIEDIFRKAGWKVTYDKPSIGDNYEAHFIFRR